MIPARFVRLDALPLTANGKLDKSALPAPNRKKRAGSEAPSAAAQPDRAAIPLEIFVEILGRDDIGVDDNFFLIGGHSLLGTQIVLRAREAFGVELTLLHLFQAQTIGMLATTIEQLILDEIESMDEDDARLLAADLTVREP